jgi:carbon storage regulator
MLVLSRKHGQSIMIGDQITVTIVELGRGRVRLGISAPASVPVHREKVALRGTMTAETKAVVAAKLPDETLVGTV